MDTLIDFTDSLSAHAGGLIEDLIAFVKGVFGSFGDLVGSSSAEDPTTVPLTPLEPATPIEPKTDDLGNPEIPGAAATW